ncbi:RICIN domain-containing protein [Streptomyces sp. NPDC057438]|uniref:RICIN domain-containing protein n=1 Tax=Streptomyces sp. NPDC057438 TaxID=3346133 RepID=UPI0036D0E745
MYRGEADDLPQLLVDRAAGDQDSRRCRTWRGRRSPHTIRIVCTGTKKASSSNTVCALDAFAHIAFPAKNGFCKMLNKSSGKAVDISGGSNSDGANIIHWTDGGAQNQRWRFVPVGVGSYEIVSQDTGKLLDVKDGLTTDGAGIVQWSDNNGANQHWTLVATGNGYDQIKNVRSDKARGAGGGRQ